MSGSATNRLIQSSMVNASESALTEGLMDANEKAKRKEEKKKKKDE